MKWRKATKKKTKKSRKKNTITVICSLRDPNIYIYIQARFTTIFGQIISKNLKVLNSLY